MGEREEINQDAGLRVGQTEKKGFRWGIARALLPKEVLKLEEFEDQTLEQIQAFQAENRRLRQQRDQLRSEVGLTKPTTWDSLLIGDYNPEEIGFDEYKKMLNYDSQVIAGWDLITMGVLMKPWRIRHPDPKVVASITAALNRLFQPNLRESMKEMLKALPYGYSVTEIVFEEWNGMWVPRQRNGFKSLDPESIKFYSDSWGNLEKIEQSLGGDLVILPTFRTMVWTHEKEWGNFYGKSLLRACYKNWFIKDAMLKFANIAYERFGSPMLVGYASNISQKDDMLEELAHLYSRSQAVIIKRDEQDPTKLEVIESKRTEMPFDRYIRYQDEMILRRMLIGQRIFEGGGGTYGPKVPFDIILMRFQDFRLELEAIMDQLLMLVSDLNWPLDIYPKFEFEPLTTMDAEQLRSTIWEALDREILDKGEPEDVTYIREQMGFPPSKKTKVGESEGESESEEGEQ